MKFWGLEVGLDGSGIDKLQPDGRHLWKSTGYDDWLNMGMKKMGQEWQIMKDKESGKRKEKS